MSQRVETDKEHLMSCCSCWSSAKLQRNAFTYKSEVNPTSAIKSLADCTPRTLADILQPSFLSFAPGHYSTRSGMVYVMDPKPPSEPLLSAPPSSLDATVEPSLDRLMDGAGGQKTPQHQGFPRDSSTEY